MNQQIQPFNQQAIAVQEPDTAPALSENPVPSVDLVAWASDAAAIVPLAAGLARTAFVPKEFQGKDNDIVAAILKGKSLGMDPMTSLESIFVVHGRPGMYARSMHSLVLAHGHKLQQVAATEQAVTVRARRKGEQDWQEFTWDTRRAERAGYTQNAKYKTNPVEMLRAKAITEACRVVFPDVIGGFRAVEEGDLGDYGDADTTSAPAPAAGKTPARRVQRKPRPQAPAPQAPAAVQNAPQESQDEPEDQEATGATEDPQEGQGGSVEYISRVDQGKISNLLEQLGITEPAEKRRFCQDFIENPDLRGVNGLTADQAKDIIATLEHEVEQYPADAQDTQA